MLSEFLKAYPADLSSAFCSTSCPCKASKTSFPSTPEYSNANFQIGGASTVSQCPKNPLEETKVRESILGLLGFFEEEFYCSGMCTKEKWYYFSDVARGPPLYKCYDKLMEYVNSI